MHRMRSVQNIMKSHSLSEKDAQILLLVKKTNDITKRHLALTGSNRGDRHNRDILIDRHYWNWRAQRSIWRNLKRRNSEAGEE